MLYMRALSYFLATLSFLFLVNIVLSFTVPSYHAWWRAVRDGSGMTSSVTHSTVDTLNDDENAASTTILRGSGGGIAPIVHIPAGTGSVSGFSGGVSTLTGALATASGGLSGKAIPLPEAFVNKTSGKLILERINNTGIFGITTVDPKGYTTYLDVAKNIKIFAFDTDSSILTDKVEDISSLYTLRKTKTFFDSTLFFNRKQPDTLIRMIITVESKDIAIEAPTSAYDDIRSILLTK